MGLFLLEGIKKMERITRKELVRIYPVDNVEFNNWIKLDFNNDGIPDYGSPYKLRAELIKKKKDLQNIGDRYKIGRAFYHMAQRRGFKTVERQEEVKNINIEGSKDTNTLGV